MRILLFLLACTSFFFLGSCEADGDNPNRDSLGTGWTKIPVATDWPVFDIHFIGNTGFYVADSSVYKSTDGGSTWQNIYKIADRTIGIEMGSTQNVIMIPSEGFADMTLYVSQNGGTSFTPVSLPGSYLTDVFFVSPTTVYAVGKYFYKSTNGGLTWSAPGYQFEYGNSSTLYFLNSTFGWVNTIHGVYKTVNGGLNWDKVATPGFDYLVTTSIFFTAADAGYAADEYNVWKTTNSGAIWTKVHSNTTERTGSQLHFFDVNNGYITDKHLYKTTDGGQTWTRELRVAQNHGLLKVFFTDPDHGWAGGSEGSLYKYVR